MNKADFFTGYFVGAGIVGLVTFVWLYFHFKYHHWGKHAESARSVR